MLTLRRYRYNHLSSLNSAQLRSLVLFGAVFGVAGTIWLWNTRANTPTGYVALHVTQQEIQEWKKRAQSGPFKTTGDFSTNSPGHWNEMQAAMSLDFSKGRWGGPTSIDSTGKVVRGGLTNDPPGSTRQMAHDMMSAAYAAIVTGNTQVAQRITAEIKAQSQVRTLDFSNRTLYPYSYYDDINPLFMYALWGRDLLMAYDIAKAMGYGDAGVEKWFKDLADLNEQAVNRNVGNVFPDRMQGNYTNRATWVDDANHTSCWRKADGSTVSMPRIPMFYNNRRNNQIGYVGLVGAAFNESRFKNSYKVYAKEWVMFGHRTADGVHGDYNRGSDSFPQLGLSYAFHGNEGIILAADALARLGDTEIYDFKSSEGSKGTGGTAEPNKSFESVINSYIKWVKQEYPATYDGSGCPPATSVTGNATYRIVPRNMTNGRELINDGTLLRPANYFNRADWRDAVLRVTTPTKFTQYVQSVGTIGNARSDWRTRFLVSLDVNPYTSSGTSNSTDTTAPSVSITSPVNGSTVSGTLTISANASDNVGVSKVEFYRGSTLIRTDTGAPYTASWDTTTIANAGYDLTAKAYDAAGNVTTSSVVRVTVSNQVAQPLPPGTFNTTSSWQNQAITRQTGAFSFSFDAVPATNGIDAVIGLSNGLVSTYNGLAAIVRFNNQGFIDARNGSTYAAETALQYTPGTPYRFRLDIDIPSKTYQVTVTPTGQASVVIARNYAFRTDQAAVSELNNWGFVHTGIDQGATISNVQVGTSQPADTTAPSVSLSAPSAGATLSGSVAISATASDNVGVSKVEFYRNDQLVVTDTSAPYGFSWDTTLVNDGSYSLSARAYDAAGNSTMSDAVSVTVKNASDADTSAPSVPGGLSGTAVSSSQINLQWNASTDNVGVAGYDVYRNAVRIATVSGTSFGDSGLPAGTTFSYYVVARDAAGNTSAASSVINVSTLAAPTPDPVSTGSVQGTVSSSSGGTLAGSKVTLTVDGRRSTYNTSADGFYAFTDLNAGDYRVEYDRSQHRAQSKTITIVSDRTATVNVVLESRR
jgi:hypothetical protein